MRNQEQHATNLFESLPDRKKYIIRNESGREASGAVGARTVFEKVIFIVTSVDAFENGLW